MVAIQIQSIAKSKLYLQKVFLVDTWRKRIEMKFKKSENKRQRFLEGSYTYLNVVDADTNAYKRALLPFFSLE